MLFVWINLICTGTRWDDFIRDVLITSIFLWYFKKFGFKSVHKHSFLYLSCSTKRKGIKIIPWTTGEYFLTTAEYSFVFMDVLCYWQFSIDLPFNSETLVLLWKVKRWWFNYNLWDNMDYFKTAWQWNNDNYMVIFVTNLPCPHGNRSSCHLHLEMNITAAQHNPGWRVRWNGNTLK